MIKKLTLLMLCFFGMTKAKAQEAAAPADTTKTWQTKGNASLLLTNLPLTTG